MTVFLLFLMLAMGPAQRLIVFPMCWLLPARRTQILGSWIRAMARITRAIVCYGAGVRIHVTGKTVHESSIVVMNHQSVLDVMILLSELQGPGVLIPVRTRYLRGIPGISPFLRMARYPSIGQKRETIVRDVAAITEGADRVAAGTATIAVFPEGHRTRSGAIERFMPKGLQTLVARSGRPVYCFVGDGMWQVRTLADAMTSLAGTHVDVRVMGPFMPPADQRDIPAFIESLRETMVQTLAQIRAQGEPVSPEVRVVD